MRSKIPDLQRALEGRFDDHHALMCRLHLAHLDQLDAMIGALDEQIEQLMHPFCARRELIASIPGIGVGASATVISEIGADPAAWFPSAEHLASWVRLCPGNHESAGKRHHGARRTGNQHLQPVLVECAWAAVRTDGYLRECRKHRRRPRTGKHPQRINLRRQHRIIHQPSPFPYRTSRPMTQATVHVSVLVEQTVGKRRDE
nr:IS110 family transposase [Mycobacterium tuberculosis]